MPPLPPITPRSRRRTTPPLTPILAFALTAALAAGTLPRAEAEGLSGTEISDPRQDVSTHGKHTGAQRRTVDLLEVAYTNDGATLTIVSTVVDLAGTPGRQFVDTTVRQRVEGTRRTWVLSSRVGADKVMIGTGSAFYRCEGATSTADEATDTVAQVLPLLCLDGFTRPKLRTAASVVRRNGAPITDDRARSTRFDVTPGG